ncbi:MAG: DUF1080 domain-containing protein [Spirosomaceae bacterium]|jgi:hypothetical protein|nr:DUF1080 domain-containing protein [Spirosomataceae bacterium]
MYRQLITIFLVSAAHFAFCQKQAEFPLKKLPIENWKIEGSKWQKAKDFSVFPELFESKKFKLESGNEILFAKDGAGIVSSNVSTKDVKLRFEFALDGMSRNTVFIQGKYGIALNYPMQSYPMGSILGEKTILPTKYSSKEAGLWQTIEIVFSAKDGNKPATIEKIVVNGLTVQQNIVLNKPTTDAPFIGSENPLAIANHAGKIAIRNVEYLPYETGNPITISDLTYKIQETQDWDRTFEVKDTKPEMGTSSQLTAEVQTNFKRFILTYTGKMNVNKTDKYALTIDYMGVGNLKIDGKDVVGSTEYLYRSPQTGFVELTAGEHTFEYRYQRIWWRPALGLFVSSAEIRPYPLHPASSLPDPEPVSEIFVNPNSQKAEMIRSFVMFENKKRTHVISVGIKNNHQVKVNDLDLFQNINYSFDLNQGTLLYAWKGDFANVTEMWHERGEPQILQPNGLITKFEGKPAFVDINKPSPDSLDQEKDLIFKKYEIYNGFPFFTYHYGGIDYRINYSIKDYTLVCDVAASSPSNIYYKAMSGKSITQINKTTYLIDDKYVYLHGKAKPIIRNAKAGQELLLPLSSPIKYMVNW